MSKMAMGILLALLIGWYIGWCHAHATVATECKRLGRFYVGRTVYQCVEIDEVESGDINHDE